MESVLYDKEINFVRIKAALFHVRRAKVGPSHFDKHEKSHLTPSMIYTNVHWLLGVGKEL